MKYFKQYVLENYLNDKGFGGDFARDTLDTEDFPLSNDYSKLNNYLLFYKNACKEAEEAFNMIYKNFKKDCKEDIQAYKNLVPNKKQMAVNQDAFMLNLLINYANENCHGHFTLLKFTTNWKCCLRTIEGDTRAMIRRMAPADNMAGAIVKAINRHINEMCITKKGVSENE